MDITFFCNGKEVKVNVSPRESLLNVLRNKLNLQGTKKGCDQGDCGSCSVIMNEKLINSCLVLAGKLPGAKVTTIEGLSENGILHPIQQAFIKTGAIQCGFCTPGMVMAAYALLLNNKKPTRDEIREGLSGNLCRCTGYSKIIEAVEMAAGYLIDSNHVQLDKSREDSQMNANVGKSIERNEGREKVTGKAVYADDINLPGQLYLKVLRSPVAHAEIISIDISQAERIPGVIKVFTARDVPGTNLVGRIKKDQPVLADKKVRFVGEPVALVAAETSEIAEKALEKINVRFEELEPVLSFEDALKTGAPLIHDDGNIVFQESFKSGDVENAFREADHIISNRYKTVWHDHAYIEPEACVGFIDEQGRIVVMTPHQHPHQLWGDVAGAIGLPIEKLRIIHTITGGAFGGKIDVCLEGFVALAVHYLQKPIKITLTRQESLNTTSKRLPFDIEYSTAARKDGKIMGIKAILHADNGAYAISGPAVMRRAAIHVSGPYEVKNVFVEATSVYTNNPVSGQMRGFGVTEIAIAHEGQMDELARTLKIDPVTIRKINGLKPGSRTITSQLLPSSVGLIPTLEALVKNRNKLKKLPTYGKARGTGIGSMYYGIGKTGKSVPSTVRVRYYGSKVEVYTGAVEIGQGSDTILKQIAADSFNLPFSKVDLITGDTALTPDSGPTSASRQTYMTGNAICLAAEKILKSWEKNIQDLEYIEEEVTYSAKTTPVESEGFIGNPYEEYAFASHLVEVLVDKSTGQVEITQVIAAHDVGKAINPNMVEGQIEGGVVMGVGYALYENFIPGITQSLREYTIPTILDAPEINSIIIEEMHPLGPFGAKGVGEPAMIPTTPAIISAIYDAVGVKINSLPCTPENIYFNIKK